MKGHDDRVSLLSLTPSGNSFSATRFFCSDDIKHSKKMRLDSWKNFAGLTCLKCECVATFFRHCLQWITDMFFPPFLSSYWNHMTVGTISNVSYSTYVDFAYFLIAGTMILGKELEKSLRGDLNDPQHNIIADEWLKTTTTKKKKLQFDF